LAPEGINGVTLKTWQATLQAKTVIEPDSSNPRADFQRYKDALLSRRMIQVHEEWVWVPLGP
jgi:hypothetical protein